MKIHQIALLLCLIGLAGASSLRANEEIPSCEDCPEPVPVSLYYNDPIRRLVIERKGTIRFSSNSTDQATLEVWSSGETNARKILQFNIAWERSANGQYYFSGNIDSGQKIELRAFGGRNATGIFDASHLHDITIRDLPDGANRWDRKLKLSGQVRLFMPGNAFENDPTRTHLEPTNAKIDFTLPLRKSAGRRGSLGLSAEAGAWIDTFDSEFRVSPGARATIRLRF